jgi:hypothetical protein
LSASDKCRQVRNCGEWSPEQLATTTPRTMRPPKGFPPKAASTL